MKLGRHLHPSLPPARLDRQLAAVRARLDRPRRRVGPFLYVAAAALCAVVAIALFLRRPAPRALAGTSIESGAAGGHVVDLPDGSRIDVARASRLTIGRADASGVAIALVRGRATFDVTPRGTRTFEITAGKYAVFVRGTRFSVDIDEMDRVSVVVEHGSVEVRSAEGSRLLETGESWSSPAARIADPAPSSSAAPIPTSDTSGAPEAPPPPSAEPPKPATAKDLLEEAQSARAAGKLRDAARAFDTLRRRFRGDARAGLAAFELGRLRMDSLHDPAGALEALGDAIAISPSGPFREDAEARRVRLLAASPACASARDAYVARYPRGAHRVEVETACKP